MNPCAYCDNPDAALVDGALHRAFCNADCRDRWMDQAVERALEARR